jgi:hypothetical protein
VFIELINLKKFDIFSEAGFKAFNAETSKSSFVILRNKTPRNIRGLNMGEGMRYDENYISRNSVLYESLLTN